MRSSFQVTLAEDLKLYMMIEQHLFALLHIHKLEKLFRYNIMQTFFRHNIKVQFSASKNVSIL